MSLRTRLFLTYGLIILFCLALVSVFVTVMLQQYRDRLTMDRLVEAARPLAAQVRTLLRDPGTDVWTALGRVAEQDNVYILFGNAQGNLVRSISPDPTDSSALDVPAGALPPATTAKQGMFTTVSGQTFIYASFPVGAAARAGLPALSTVVIAVPRAGSLALWATVLRPVLLAGLIALGISLIAAVFLARSVYAPFALVAQAAGKIARGQYDQKIPVSGPREVKELATSFNRMTDEVKDSQQQLRHFVADISHQLRSPLTSIQGFAQAMLDGTASSQAERDRAASIIYEESRVMRRQVDELLELSRMQSGQMKMTLEPVEMRDLIEHCYELYSIQAMDKAITLTREAESSLGVMGDADRLEQVFNNLLDNAIKNTPAHGKVSITGQRVDKVVEVRVADDGPGIPTEQIPHVFERFYQVTGVRTGVGLGLAIAREIVLAHGGTIEARSEPGSGAEFIVRLPLRTTQVDSEPIFKG